MRRFRAAAALVAASLALASACDSDQPIGEGSQRLELFVTAQGTSELWDVYDVRVDTDGDGVPDTEADFDLCVQALNDVGDPLTTTTRVPWPYSAEIKLLDAGETQPRVLVTSLGGDREFSSITPYETVFFAAPVRAAEPPLFFENGKRLPTGNREFLERCTSAQTPEPNILGEPYPFELTLGTGDTMIFTARKAESDELETLIYPYTGVTLSAELFLDGRAVVPSGTTSSTNAEGAGVSFSFTLR